MKKSKVENDLYHMEVEKKNKKKKILKFYKWGNVLLGISTIILALFTITIDVLIDSNKSKSETILGNFTEYQKDVQSEMLMKHNFQIISLMKTDSIERKSILLSQYLRNIHTFKVNQVLHTNLPKDKNEDSVKFNRRYHNLLEMKDTKLESLVANNITSINNESKGFFLKIKIFTLIKRYSIIVLLLMQGGGLFLNFRALHYQIEYGF